MKIHYTVNLFSEKIVLLLHTLSLNKFITINSGQFSTYQRKNIVFAKVLQRDFFNIISIIYIIFSILTLNCSGILKKEYPEKKYFILEPDYKKNTIILKNFRNIKLNKIKISPFFEGKNFVYRQGEFSYESDYYNEFLIFPSSNLSECIHKWIEMISGSSGNDYLLLNILVDSLYIDMRNLKEPKAIWDITFMLQKNNEEVNIFKKKYSYEKIITQNTPESIINSWNYGLTEILFRLSSDLLEFKFPEPQNEISDKPSQKVKTK